MSTKVIDSEHAQFVVATIRQWNVDEFERRMPDFPGRWRLISDHASLDVALIRSLEPRYVFFPHWSWRVPDEMLAASECVSFHMTDVPYGRGGTPLQNLISQGHTETILSALRMVPELDAGPVYMKRALSLEGSAQEIYTRCARLTFDMIAEIIVEQPQPVPQPGTPVVFSRRRPEESRLPPYASPRALYDHIRMLDAEEYPRAFLDYGDFRLEFRDARLDDDTVEARVTFRKDDDS